MWAEVRLLSVGETSQTVDLLNDLVNCSETVSLV